MRTNRENSLLLRTRLLAKRNLIYKYNVDDKQYRIKILDEILFNENTHLVTRFKDYLIYDDNNEFISKFYALREIEVVLPFILEYYINYSKINPSFILNKQGKMLYKNFHRKQKLYLSKHKMNDEENKLPIASSNILESKYLRTINKEVNTASEILRKSILGFSNTSKKEEIFLNPKKFFEDSFVNSGINLQQSLMLSFLDKLNSSCSTKTSKLAFIRELEGKSEKEINSTFEGFNLNDNSVTIKNKVTSIKITQEKNILNDFAYRHINYATLKNKHYHQTNFERPNSKHGNMHFNKEKINEFYNNKINKKNLLLNKKKENTNIFYNLKIRVNKINQKKASKTLINKGNKVCSRVPSFKYDQINKIKFQSDNNNNKEITTKKLNFIKDDVNLGLKKQSKPNILAKKAFNKNKLNHDNKNKTKPLTKDAQNYYNNYLPNFELNNEFPYCDLFANTTTTTPSNKKSSNDLIINKKEKTVNSISLSRYNHSEKEIQNNIVAINKDQTRSSNSLNQNLQKIQSYSPPIKKLSLNTRNNVSSYYSSKNNIEPKVFSEDKTIIKRTQVSKLSEYSKKMDFIINTVKKLSRNIKKENILLDINSRNKQNFKIISNSRSSNLNNMFSTNSNTVNSDKTQTNSVSGYFDKKFISDDKYKLKLNLLQQEEGIKTDRINMDRKFYERFKIDMISIDFNDCKNFQTYKQNPLEKGKTFNVSIEI